MHGKGISAIALLSILSYATAQEYTDLHAREADPDAKFNFNHAVGDVGKIRVYPSSIPGQGINSVSQPKVMAQFKAVS